MGAAGLYVLGDGAGVAPAPSSRALPTQPALTTLRFVAALLVFLFHFQPKTILWAPIATQGHVGVSLFFVLSGFLISGRYAEPFDRGDVRLFDYWIRRAARILPLYYAVFILSQLAAAGRVSISTDTWPEWTLTQALFGESLHRFVIPTSWSLTVEECFYLLAPAVFALLRWATARLPFDPPSRSRSRSGA